MEKRENVVFFPVRVKLNHMVVLTYLLSNLEGRSQTDPLKTAFLEMVYGLNCQST